MRQSLPLPAWPARRAGRSRAARASAYGGAAGLAAAALAFSVAAGAGMQAAAAAAVPAGTRNAAASAGVRQTAAIRTAGRVPITAALRPVLLINGDRVIVRPRPGGGSLAMLLPPAGTGRPSRSGRQDSVGQPATVTFTAGGHSYLIPGTALPYLGRGLDLSLFDLSALRRAEARGRLPVRIAYHRHLPALPGLHITGPTVASRGERGAAGYLTAASASLLGAALTRQPAAGPGHAAHAGGLFADGASISLVGAARPTAARSARRLHTLTVTGRNLTGRPDDDDTVFVSNVDDSRRFVGEKGFRDGTATFRVPAGHYFAVGDFLEQNAAHTQFTQERVVILPQFTVTGNTKVHVAERAASSKITMVTPRPATVEDSDFEVRRPGRAGPVQFWASSESSPNPPSLWVSPDRHRVSTGKLQTFAAQQLVSPAGAAGPPTSTRWPTRARRGSSQASVM